ncbi:MAG: precorrin-3B C(17)-methyltransferase [Desulfobacteraceae bacterium]
MTVRAHQVLTSVDAVAGYITYIDLVRDLIRDKEIIATSMKKEVDRVEKAVATALQGKSCAVVSSGDAGVYAMAGLVFEMCSRKEITLNRPGQNRENSGLTLEVVPGVPALCSAGALLGAPLTHDFAAVSLSDLLTPWEKIEKRIEAAAEADFVIALYNPKSRKRDWQLARARDILLKYRDPDTPAGIVINAMRPDETVLVTTLGGLHEHNVNMLTTVFIGNSATYTYQDFMITPRGYSEKYSLGKTGAG